jgi:YD repeat-containing protein
MKTFRLIGMALLAVCVSFASCSSDDEEPAKNDDGVITNQKLLVELRMTDEDGESVITEYSYDSKGKLLSANRRDSDYGREYTITWGANKIIESGNRDAITYTLEDGLITHTSDSDGGDLENATFTYNANKQLIKLQYSENEYTVFTWQGEKLTKMTWNFSDEDIYELSYSGKTCKGYLPIMVWNVDDLRPLLEAHPELVGMRCNQLPDKAYSKEEIYEITEQYTYTFDKDGYVESCTEVSTYKRLDIDETRTETTIYTFTWE